jgi:hypothetical protein
MTALLSLKAMSTIILMKVVGICTTPQPAMDDTKSDGMGIRKIRNQETASQQKMLSKLFKQHQIITTGLSSS